MIRNLYKGRQPRRSTTSGVLYQEMLDHLIKDELDDDTRRVRVTLTKFRVQLETLDAINRVNRTTTVAAALLVGIVAGAIIAAAWLLGGMAAGKVM